MKRLFRNRILSTFLLLIIIQASNCVLAQSPDPKFDSSFTKAKQLEAEQPDKAFDAYATVKKEAKDPELGADALLRAALFAESPAFGNTEEMHQQGEVKAHDTFKQLEQQYPDSRAGKYARDSQLKEQVEKRIDKRNSSKWNYKLVDTLVAMTGRISSFSYWFALLIIAVLVKTITMPLTLKMYKSQREMQRIQPILKDLQEQYKNDKVVLNQKVMECYKEHGVNPFASCLPMFIQLPFMIWVYNTIRLYEFHFANGKFLWVGSSLAHQFPKFLGGNMSQFDIPLLCLYAGSNYLTMKLTPATDPQAAQSQKTMSVMMTAMMFWMFLQYRWSAAFIFYWLMMNIFSAWQQYTYIYKPNKIRLSAAGEAILLPKEKNNSNSNGAKAPRMATPIPGGNAPRPRPRRKK